MAQASRSVRWFEAACFGFLLLGLVLPWAYASPLFAVYRTMIDRAVGESVADGGGARFLVGLTGGAIAGKWAAHWVVARFGLRARQRWAVRASLVGLLGWFVVDSTTSLLAGAWANVLLVNLMPLAVGLPLLRVIARETDHDDAPPTATRASAVAAVVSALCVVAGIVLAFSLHSSLFAPWQTWFLAKFFPGRAFDGGPLGLVRWFAGPIGGSTVGHFALLFFLARYVPTRSALLAGAVSLLIWLAVIGVVIASAT